MLCLPTGFGKSVYMPYRLLMSDLSKEGTIWVTEPRLSVLRPKEVNGKGTIPSYIGTSLLRAPHPGYGKGFEVGVRYKDDNQAMFDADNNRLIFCSDGLLLRMLMSGDLDGVKVLVIDEAHEMSENMSVLYSLLKLTLVLYPELRIVFASATVDSQAWIDFYAPYEVKVIAPEGPCIAHKHPITVHWPLVADCDQSPILGYCETFGFTEGIPSFKEANEARDIPAITSLIVNGIRSGVVGTLQNRFASCLVFVPTQALLIKTVAALRALNLPGLKVCVAYAEATSAERAEFADSEQRIEGGTWPSDWQRVVVATNTLETGVTYCFDYVLEPGFCLNKRWVSRLATYQYVTERATRDKLKQRWGRVGRISQGEVIPYYSKATFMKQPEFSRPTLTNCSLDGVLLSLLRSGLTSIKNVPIFGVDLEDEAMAFEYNRAVAQLRVSGAIDSQGRLTEAGGLLESSGTGVVNLGAMLLWGEEFGFAAEIATFVAFLSLRASAHIFSNDDKGLLAKHRFSVNCLDDLEFYLKVYLFWSEAQKASQQSEKKRRRADKFRSELCDAEGLEDRTLRLVQSRQASLLREFERGSHETQALRAFDLARVHRMRAAIARSSPEWIFVKNEAGVFVPAFPALCPIDGAVQIDRSSSCATTGDLNAFVCIDRSSVGDMVFARHIVRVEPEWLAFLEAGDERALHRAVRKAIQTKSCYTDGVVERITSPPLLTPNLQRFQIKDLLHFTILQQQPSQSGLGFWSLIQLKDTGETIAARIAHTHLECGVEMRAHIVNIDTQNIVLELTQDIIRQGYIDAKQLVQATVIEKFLSDVDADVIAGLIVEIEPGLRGTLYAEKLGNFAVALKGFSLGDQLAVFPLSVNKRSRLLVAGPRSEELINDSAYVRALACSFIPEQQWGALCLDEWPLPTSNQMAELCVVGVIEYERGPLAVASTRFGHYLVTALDVTVVQQETISVFTSADIGRGPLFRLKSTKGPTAVYSTDKWVNGLRVLNVERYADSGRIHRVELGSEYKFRSFIDSRDMQCYEAVLEDLRPGDTLVPLKPVKLKPEGLYFGIGEYMLDQVLVMARVSRIINSDPDNGFIAFQIAPNNRGTLGSKNGAGFLLNASEVQEGDVVPLVVLGRSTHKGQTDWILGHELFNVDPVVGRVYEGWINADYVTELGGFRVDFLPGSRSGRLRVAPENVHLFCKGRIVVELLRISTDRSGKECYELIQSYEEPLCETRNNDNYFRFSLKIQI